MWPYGRRHFQLHIYFWPLHWLGESFLWVTKCESSTSNYRSFKIVFEMQNIKGDASGVSLSLPLSKGIKHVLVNCALLSSKWCFIFWAHHLIPWSKWHIIWVLPCILQTLSCTTLKYRYTNCNWMYDGQIEFNVLIWRDFDVNESIWAHCWWYMDIEVIPSDDQTPRHNIFFKSITMLRGIDNTPWNIPWCSPHSSYWMWEMSRNIMWYTTSPT